MPRFALLRHTCPPQFDKLSHWDLFLENGDRLDAWSMEELPSGWSSALGRRSDVQPAEEGASQVVDAVPLLPHRLIYLDFEGPLTGGRGSVTRCDAGAYCTLERNDAEWSFWLDGEFLKGTACLRRAVETWSLDWAP